LVSPAGAVCCGLSGEKGKCGKKKGKNQRIVEDAILERDSSGHGGFRNKKGHP